MARALVVFSSGLVCLCAPRVALAHGSFSAGAAEVYATGAVLLHGPLVMLLSAISVLTWCFSARPDRHLSSCHRAVSTTALSVAVFLSLGGLDLVGAMLRGAPSDLFYRASLAVALLALVRVPFWAEKYLPPGCEVVHKRGVAPQVVVLAITLGEWSGHCPVCRQPTTGQAVVCPACRTPHHVDCMEYNGRCGIYACQPSSISRVIVPCQRDGGPSHRGPVGHGASSVSAHTRRTIPQ